jgi:hypothetical protein
LIRRWNLGFKRWDIGDRLLIGRWDLGDGIVVNWKLRNIDDGERGEGGVRGIIWRWIDHWEVGLSVRIRSGLHVGRLQSRRLSCLGKVYVWAVFLHMCYLLHLL